MEVDLSEMSCWQYLPPVILTEIFSNLSLSNRYKASLVCRTWSPTFRSPQIWRTFRFQFQGDSRKPTHDFKAVQFARKFGEHARKIEITCRRPTHFGCRRLHKKLIAFFLALRNKTQLRHLSILDFNFRSAWSNEALVSQIITCIQEFLKRQFRLVLLDLRAMDVRIVNGVQIIQSALSRCSGTIKYLLLEDFISPRENLLKNVGFMNLISGWKILHTVALNYAMLDDDSLMKLVKNNAKTLKILQIKTRKREGHSHTICNMTWISVLKLCPDLKVNLTIERIPIFAQFGHLLQKNLPLARIKFTAGYDEAEAYWGMVEFLTQLKAYFTNTLESLVLEFDDHLEFVDNALLDLVSSCPKLETIEINAILHIYTVDVLCSVITGTNSGVRKLHLVLYGLAHCDLAMLHEIKAKHLPKLTEKNIDFVYSGDWVT